MAPKLQIINQSWWVLIITHTYYKDSWTTSQLLCIPKQLDHPGYLWLYHDTEWPNLQYLMTIQCMNQIEISSTPLHEADIKDSEWWYCKQRAPQNCCADKSKWWWARAELSTNHKYDNQWTTEKYSKTAWITPSIPACNAEHNWAMQPASNFWICLSGFHIIQMYCPLVAPTTPIWLVKWNCWLSKNPY